MNQVYHGCRNTEQCVRNSTFSGACYVRQPKYLSSSRFICQIDPLDDIVREHFPRVSQTDEVWVPRSALGIRKELWTLS